ncbi:MAG: dinitrogenase iron-molybdenum cofactor biosynthesis protein [Spirochaetales bacterium]|nr:dinitrogenase iron-molybdenum cofactor biosynthesis protein [Spirochaetales bacterium]
MNNGRIAIPSEGKGGLGGIRSGHFGHCEVFTLVDVKEGVISGVTTIPNQEHTEGGCLVPVNLLAQHKVNAIIVGGMGMRPLMGFNEVGIDVYHEATCAEIKPVVEYLIAGKLKMMTPDKACGGGNH